MTHVDGNLRVNEDGVHVEEVSPKISGCLVPSSDFGFFFVTAALISINSAERERDANVFQSKMIKHDSIMSLIVTIVGLPRKMK